MTGELTQVGIVVIGRNEGERLRRCLRSLPERTSVVYVDSASTDGSLEFAESRGIDVVQLDLTKPFTAARARNAGASRILEKAPETAFVQFVDGDCELEEDWMLEALSFLSRNGSVAAVCGRRRERYPDGTFYNGICDREWNTPVGEAAACGGDALFRVPALRQCGFYDASLIAGEEPELCYRLRQLGWLVWRIDQPMTIHDADMHQFRQWWRRAVRSGFGYAQVWHKTVKGPSSGLYSKQLARAFGWTLGPPMMGFFLSLWIGPIALLIVPAPWLVQFARLARRHGPAESFHLLVAKLAESVGALRYVLALVTLKPAKAIFYK